VAKPTASTPKAKRLQKIWVAETKKDALAIADHGGEILKFIGDGLLAIFPLAAFEGVGRRRYERDGGGARGVGRGARDRA
jgi:class 3 adenylate cyclase